MISEKDVQTFRDVSSCSSHAEAIYSFTFHSIYIFISFQVLITFLCCLSFKDILSKDVNATASVKLKDNDSASSATNQLLSLFRDAPTAIYASAVPHGAYSFHAPVYHKSGPGLVVPVHNENIVIHKQSGFLTDSYGNKFLESPRQVAYKTTFPQQFVPLQDLPAHLSQPLVAASPGIQFSQNVPHFSYGSPVRVQSPSSQLSAHHSFPLVYAEKNGFSGRVPARFTPVPVASTVSQQSTNQRPVYSSANPHNRVANLRAAPAQFQRPEQKSQAIHSDNNPHIQKVIHNNANLKQKPILNTKAEQVTITTVDDGKESVISLPSRPPVPHLLDISLLEPLVFDNPVVPQVQLYLPRINYATYNKIPQVNQQQQHKHKEILVQNTKYYSSPVNSNAPKEEPNEEVNNNSEKYHEHTHKNRPSEFRPSAHRDEIPYNQKKKFPGREPNYYFEDKKINSENENDQDAPRHLIYNGNPEEHDESSEKQNSYEDQDEIPVHFPQIPKEHSHREEFHEKPKYQSEQDERHHSPAPKEHYYKQQYHERPYPHTERDEIPHHHSKGQREGNHKTPKQRPEQDTFPHNPTASKEHYHKQQYHKNAQHNTDQDEILQPHSKTQKEQYHKQQYHDTPQHHEEDDITHHHSKPLKESYHKEQHDDTSHHYKQDKIRQNHSKAPREQYHKQQHHETPQHHKQEEIIFHHTKAPKKQYHEQDEITQSHSKPLKQHFHKEQHDDTSHHYKQDEITDSKAPKEQYHKLQLDETPQHHKKEEITYHHTKAPKKHYKEQNHETAQHHEQDEITESHSKPLKEHYHKEQHDETPHHYKQHEVTHNHSKAPREHYHKQQNHETVQHHEQDEITHHSEPLKENYHKEHNNDTPQYHKDEVTQNHSTIPKEQYHKQQFHETPQRHEQDEITQHHPKAPNEHDHKEQYHKTPHHHEEDEITDHDSKSPKEHYHETPQNHHEQGEIRQHHTPIQKQEYHEHNEKHPHTPQNNPNQHYIKQEVKERTPKQYSHSTEIPKQANVHNEQQFQPIHPHWEEKSPPTRPKQAQIKVIPQQTSPLSPTFHELEKAERIIIKEETPVDMHSLKEQMIAEMIKEEENNEEDFDKAYKNAAFGFPAYNHKPKEESEFYNPESYGAPKYHEGYSFENSPFEQYESEGDNFPKSSRLTYKDMRDHNTDQYYKEYESVKPQTLNEYNKQKEDYFQSYEQHKPENYFTNKKKNNTPKKSEQYRVENVFDFKPTSTPKSHKYFAQYKSKPARYEYDYSKGDSHAHSSQPSQSYRNKWTNTHFVEPQFQYGFEPIPRLLDSELAAMASNDSPESESPGTRKKMYKENWYIHKTSTLAKNTDS